MSRIELAGLAKSFGRTEVVVGVDLVVGDGSTTAVLGSSGGGKTTLLRLLAGFERVDAGCIRIGEEVVDDGRRFVRPQRRSIGYVPQDAALFPHLDVTANIGFGVGRTRRASIPDLLELVGLGGLGDRMPHQLSGGQQQRVALARALAISPSVVLLDEPFGSLDAGLRESLRADVSAVLQELRATTILVTHDQNEALSFADTIAVLRGGRIVACSPPQQLYLRPPDPATAAFIGESNLLDGTAVAGSVETPVGVLTPSQPLPDGRCTVMVRPEQLVLSDDDSGGRPAATVVESTYRGHEAMAKVSVAGRILLVRLPGDSALSTGTRVSVRVAGPVMAWPEPA